MVAERYGTEHHEFVVTPDAQAIFPELVWHYNEPFADSSAIPTYYVSKMAREYVTVILTGDAGDENFAGYPRYQFTGEYELKAGFPSLWHRLVAARHSLTGAYINPDDPLGTFRRLRDLNQERLLYYLRITHFHEAYQQRLYSPDFRARLGKTYTVDWMLERYRNSDAGDFLDATLGLDLSLYLPDTLMTKVDIASMAHSLEARAPMLDHLFLEFAATIPSELKLKDGESKYIFKKAVEAYLPKEVIYRKKMGFGVPLDHWFRHELKEMLSDVLLSQRALGRGYFQPDYIRNMIERHQQGENWQYLLWNLLMLELWHLMFIDKEMPYPSAHAAEGP
jgi:asparagine synthase (glutamine-hydrolysing)